MNMVRQELRMQFKTTLVWTLCMMGMAALYLGLFPGVTRDIAGFKQLLGAYPPAVRAMLGVDLDTIGSLLGYYGMVFSFVAIFGAIQAMNFGIGIVTRESRERTADFLLAKPVSRFSVVTAKLAAALTLLLGTDLAYYAFANAFARAVSKAAFSGRLFLLVNLSLLFTQIIFLALGMGAAVFFRVLRSTLPLSLCTVFGLYAAGALFATGKDKDIVRFFCPLKYFDPVYISAHGAYETRYLVAGAAVAAAGIAAAYLVYLRKDIHAVS